MKKYVIELTQKNKISEKINLSGWVKLRDGAAHLILEHPCQKFVLSIPLRLAEPQAGPLEQIYESILGSSHVSKFLNAAEKYRLTEASQCVFQDFLTTCTDFPEIQLPVKDIYKSQNLKLLQGEWDCILQFKVKSPLPQVFTHTQLTNHNEVNALCQGLPQEMRTRWWAKAGFTSQNKHINPITLFQLHHTIDFVPFINSISPQMTEYLKNTQYKQQFNNKILRQLKLSLVLSQIFKLQCLNSIPPQYLISLTKQILQGKSLPQSQLLIAMNRIKEGMRQTASQSVSDRIKKQFQKPFVRANIEQETTIEHVLRFLISLVWKDISIIVRMSEQGAFQLRIIDYYLKPLRKVEGDSQKRKNLLQRWVKWMQMRSDERRLLQQQGQQ